MMMKFLYILVAIFVIVAVDINGVNGGAMVTGTVFCDRCKDGQVSLFDYPLSGMKVTMECPGNDGQMTIVGEDTSNMLGNYGITFDGTPDLTNCFTRISPESTSNQDPNSCGASTGPPKSVRLMFNMFDMEMYAVDPLISQPAQPMSFCSKSSSPPPSTPSPVTLPPPTRSNPPPVTPSAPPRTPAPGFRLPRIPGLPPVVMPPAPFLQKSACSYDYWMNPNYKCYWRAMSPDLTVAEVFGPLAAQKYGTHLTLYKSLKGKGDPYKTLLRESVTALLNSWNSLRFTYMAPQVLHNFNLALMGSTHDVLLTALRFKRANTGSPCKFQTCK